MERHGSVIRVKAGALGAYKRHHANVWPEVLQTIESCNIRNYSIYQKDNLLFSYFEYVGKDFAEDMRKMAADPRTREWWAVVGPLQEPLDSRAPGEWWAAMEEVFHCG